MQLTVTLDPQTGQLEIQANFPAGRDAVLRMLLTAANLVLNARPPQAPAVQPADAAGVDAILRRLGRPPVSG